MAWAKALGFIVFIIGLDVAFWGGLAGLTGWNSDVFDGVDSLVSLFVGLGASVFAMNRWMLR